MGNDLKSPVPRDVQRLVIELPSWIGDTVMATPVLRAAREFCPDAHISGIMRPGVDALLDGCAFIDDLICENPSGIKGIFNYAKKIKSVNAQAIILLPNSFRSGLAAKLSSTPVRVGYARDGRGFLLSHSLQYDKNERPISTIEYYARLAKYAFNLDSINLTPELTVTDKEREQSAGMLKDAGDKYVVLCPGGNNLQKHWPVERFSLLAEHLHNKKGLSILLSGSPPEMDVIADVAKASSVPTINLIEKGLTISTLKAVIASASLVVTNDTGPRHIAAALGTPLVTLFGPTDHRWTTLNCRHERILISEPFLPEGAVADDFPRQCAIDKIPIQDVILTADELLEEFAS